MTEGTAEMNDGRMDRIERQLEQQGEWADSKLEKLRGVADEIREETIRTAVNVENIAKALDAWRKESSGFGNAIQEIQGTLNGRHGQDGLVAQVQDLANREMERKGETKAQARMRAAVAAISGGLSGAIVAGAAVWGILAAKH
jgi:hypothetical protein